MMYWRTGAWFWGQGGPHPEFTIERTCSSWKEGTTGDWHGAGKEVRDTAGEGKVVLSDGKG